jgi:acetyl-CoA carboxylase carboxyltransferase component
VSALPEGVDEQWAPMLEEIATRRANALKLGGPERIERERRNGRSTARERIATLVDEGSFQEFGMISTTPDDDGSQKPTTFVCGIAKLDGNPIAVGAEDFTVVGGGVGVQLARFKGAWGGFIEELAYEYKIPLVLLMQGVGGSIAMQEAKGYPTLMSGWPVFPVFELLDRVPVVAAVMGPTAGSSAARAAISHFSVMSRPNGCLFAGGPPLVKQAVGIDIDKLDLGGAEVHTKQSGVIDNAADTEEEIFDQIRRFLSYLPSNVWHKPPHVPTDDPTDRSCDDLLKIVTPNPRRPYNTHRLIRSVVDRDSFFEMAPDYGRAVRTGLARIGGYPVGVLANDARHMAGAMDGPACDKQVRFAEFCDAFHLPIVYFADVPGFMVGPDAEKAGVLRRGSRAVQAIQRVSVPVYTVQVRRSYGLGGQGTGSANRASLRLAWPTGLWGDLPVQGGIEAEYRAEIEASDDPAALRAELMEKFADQASIWKTAEKFGVEEIIDPRETRRVLARLVELADVGVVPGPKQGPQVRP